MINAGSPTPSITFEIKECNGLIVVTTFISAFAVKEFININEKIKIPICPKNVLCCFILLFTSKKKVL